MDGRLGSTDLQQAAATRFVRVSGLDPTSDGSGEAPIKLARMRGAVAPAALLHVLWSSWGAAGEVERRRRLLASLEALGYDEALQLTQLRPFVLSVHSSAPVQLTAIETRGEGGEQVQCEIVLSTGKPQLLRDGITLFVLHSPGGVSFAASNSGTHDVALKLNCTQSINVRANRPTLKPIVELPAGAARLALVLMPADRMLPWNYKYRCSLLLPAAPPPPPAAPLARRSDGAPQAPPPPQPVLAPPPSTLPSEGRGAKGSEELPEANAAEGVRGGSGGRLSNGLAGDPLRIDEAGNFEGKRRGGLAHTVEEHPDHKPCLAKEPGWRACESCRVQ